MEYEGHHQAIATENSRVMRTRFQNLSCSSVVLCALVVEESKNLATEDTEDHGGESSREDSLI